MVRKSTLKQGYRSPDCEVRYFSPQSQILALSENATIDAFVVNDDSSDPYFG